MPLSNGKTQLMSNEESRVLFGPTRRAALLAVEIRIGHVSTIPSPRSAPTSGPHRTDGLVPLSLALKAG
jgi:hypothetical protein